MKQSVLVLLLLAASSVRAEEPLVQSIDVGEKTVNETVVLPDRGMLEGRSPASSCLKASANVRGALVQSEGYDELVKNKPHARWRVDGLPQMLTVRDLLLDGGQFLLDRTWETPADLAGSADGVRLFASGVDLDHVKVVNFLGAGVRLARGDGVRNGPLAPTDWEATHIERLEIGKCLEGLVVESGADGECTYVETGAIRGDGVRLEEQTGAWLFQKVHAFGCGRGVATMGGSHLFSLLEVETCGVGFHNAAGLTQVGLLKAFDCWKTAVNLERSAEVSNFVIDAKTGEALHIGPGANSSRLAGVITLGSLAPLIDPKLGPPAGPGLKPVPPPKTVGAVIESDNVELTVQIFGGQRPIVITRPVVGLALDLRLGPGADVGVELPQGLGAGSKITIRHRGCRQPVVAGVAPPKGSIEVLEQ